jgi:5-bromo-4-chloroindolyl phosphate hydrolysis protein
MRNRDYRYIGRDIHRTVRNAIRNGDFEQIGQAVENSVQEVTDDINEVLESLRTRGRHAGRSPMQGFPGTNGAPGQPGFGRMPLQGTFRRRMPGLVSGVVNTISGLILGLTFLIVDIAMLAAGLAEEIPATTFLALLCVFTPLAAGSFSLMGYGISLQRRARRFARYRDAIGGAAFCTVAKLAETVGEDPQRVRKDLKKMISTGACPQGHLDRNETCFMVDDITYEEFLEAERAYLARSKAAQEEEQRKQTDPKAAELEAVKKEGSDYLRQIREANEALPEKEISDKLDQLENVTARIFVCVEQHPEKLPDIRSFMRYYLPTTLKLVKAYREFEEQPVQGENIKKAKAEIERALDTVNVAFANLLDSLFEDDALDISADVSTLETLLRQGGLTGSDFGKMPDDGSKK